MITEDPEEDPINEDPIRTLSLRTLKRGLSLKNIKKDRITVNPKENPINEKPQQLQDPQ